MIPLYSICTVALIIYITLDLSWRFWKRKFGLHFLPNTLNIPWLGGIPFYSTDPHQAFLDREKNFVKYDRLYVTWFLYRPVLVVGRPEYAESLLKSVELIMKSSGYKSVAEWLGNGLFLASGSKWKTRRSALTGAFHFSILNDFVDIYEKHALKFVNKAMEISASTSAEIEVQWLFSLVLLDVICETSMGVNIDALNSSESEYVKSTARMKTLLMKRVRSPLFGSKLIYPHTQKGEEYYKCLNTVHSFTINVINENIAARKKNSSKEAEESSENINPSNNGHSSYRRQHRVLIDILLDLYDAGEIDVDGIREEVDTFMFAGHDTTTSALSFTLYEIARHPDIQQKLYEEILDVELTDAPLVEKIRSLKLLDCVVKESLRLHPPAPAFARKLEKDLLVGSHLIPKGVVMQIDVIALHTNPEYWVNPHLFDPMRFQNDDKRNPYCYVPFSAGPRNCIGQKFAQLEEKVFLFYILLNFRLTTTQKPEDIKKGTQIITSSLNGIYIMFSKRQ